MEIIKTKIAVAVLLFVFAAGLLFAVTGSATELELALARLLNPNAALSPVMRFFTAIGESPGVISVAAMLLLLPSRRRVGLPVAVTAIVSWLLNTFIKHIVARARPEERLLEINSYSFPSGHAMNNMALYAAVMLTVYPLCRSRIQRIILVSVCTALPLLIGISRVYFNVHYVSDVIGGWCLGAAVAVVCLSAFERTERKLSEHGKNRN